MILGERKREARERGERERREREAGEREERERGGERGRFWSRFALEAKIYCT